jgi:hypothetical protein
MLLLSRTVLPVQLPDGNPPMDPKPFVTLAVPRVVDRPDLPPALAEFYARHEGVGRDCEGYRYRSVRLHRLEEVARVGWSGLGLVGRASALGLGLLEH